MEVHRARDGSGDGGIDYGCGGSPSGGEDEATDVGPLVGDPGEGGSDLAGGAGGRGGYVRGLGALRAREGGDDLGRGWEKGQP